MHGVVRGAQRRTWVLGLLVVACGPSTPAKFGDQDKVSAANLAWCSELAKLDGESMESWRYRSECSAASPTASSPFLERFRGCYANMRRDLGDAAPDSGAIISACSEEILAGADPGDVSASGLYQARCARQERCQKVSREACDGAWARLDGRTQARLSSQYNLAAQASIQRCLADQECAEDDAAVEAACYDAAHAQLVWLPL